MGLKVAISVTFSSSVKFTSQHYKKHTLYIYTVVKVRGNIPIYKFVESIGHVVYGVATDGKRSIDVVTVNHNS